MPLPRLRRGAEEVAALCAAALLEGRPAGFSFSRADGFIPYEGGTASPLPPAAQRLLDQGLRGARAAPDGRAVLLWHDGLDARPAFLPSDRRAPSRLTRALGPGPRDGHAALVLSERWSAHERLAFAPHLDARAAEIGLRPDPDGLLALPWIQAPRIQVRLHGVRILLSLRPDGSLDDTHAPTLLQDTP